MKWVNHKLIAGATGLAISNSLVFASTAVLFATVPDSIELHNYHTNTSVFKHRGNSHNPWVWLLIITASWIIGIYIEPGSIIQISQIIPQSYQPNAIINHVFFGMIWGIFIHLITDAMTISGIPISIPLVQKKHKNKHLKFKWFYTGSQTEYAVAFAIAIASGLMIYITHGTIKI